MPTARVCGPQIVFDEVEPRSVLVSCRDERRYFVDFQSAEDCLLFRTVCYDVSMGALDVNRQGCAAAQGGGGEGGRSGRRQGVLWLRSRSNCLDAPTLPC
jgi:hypothetical protein